MEKITHKDNHVLERNVINGILRFFGKLVDSVKLKIQIVYDPTVTFLGIQPTEMSAYVH